MGSYLTSIIFVFLAFFISIVVFSIAKKLFYYFVFKKKIYIIPRLSIKGIGYLAIIIALSVTIAIILTIYTKDVAAILFRAFPGTRITFESLLIKVGGLLLGPLLGMVLGAATDGLTIVFTAGVFHYGYFIAAIAFGLIGGLIRTMIRVSNKKPQLFVLIANILMVVLTLLVCFFYAFTNFTKDGGSLSWNTFWQNLSTISILPILNIKIPVGILLVITLAMGSLTIFCFNGFYVLSKKSHFSFFKNQFEYFGPVLFLAYLSEIVISIFLLPVVDVALVSSIEYTSWLSVRVLTAPFLLTFNTLVIWPIYKSISVIFKYNYLNDYEIDDFSKEQLALQYQLNQTRNDNQKLQNNKQKTILDKYIIVTKNQVNNEKGKSKESS